MDFDIENGILKKYKGRDAEVVIPNGIKKIGEGAFACNPDIRHVVIPETVEKIGMLSFYCCVNLENVTMAGEPDIAQDAFERTAWLDNMTPPFFINRNRLHCYTGREEHVKIPKGVVSISEYAFAFNKNIRSVTIPEGVERIGESAFLMCRGLKEVQFPESLKHIGAGAFLKCNLLKKALLPAGIKSIGRYAFAECFLLKDIILYSRINAEINETAFEDCFLLEKSKIKITTEGVFNEFCNFSG